MTVGLPVRNGSGTLRRSIDSLLAQEFTDFELVISDNASSDDSFEIATEYAVRDPRIRLLRHPGNIGPIPNFKTVLAEARGQYFAFAAHDDEYEPRYLKALVNELELNPRSSVAGGRVRVVDDDALDDETVEVGVPREVLSLTRKKRALAHVRGRDQYLLLHFGLFRTPFVRAAFLPVPLVAGSDWLFVLHVLLSTDPVLIDERLMTRHVQSSRPSVAKYRGEPDTPGDNPLGWTVTCVAGLAYLLRSRGLSTEQRLFVPVVVARFALWLARLETERVFYRLATRFLGDRGRRRLGSIVRRPRRPN